MPRSSARATPPAVLPSGQTGTLEGVVAGAYHTGVKIDGAWHPFGPSYTRVDVRPGDRARVEVDAGGSVTRLEILERGTGQVAVGLMTEKQRLLIEKRCDMREKSLETLERDFFQAYVGISLAELESWEASCLISLILRRKPQSDRRDRR